MKPRTKQQIKIYALAEALPKITDKQKTWAFANCLKHIGYRNKSGRISCLDCGHQWPGVKEPAICKCPNCGVKLTVETTQNRNTDQRVFFCNLSVVEDCQVIRYWEIRSTHKSGQKAKIDIWEVVVQFADEQGIVKEVVARNRGGMGWYQDGFHGYLEIRKYSYHKFDIWPEGIYPKMKVLPVFTRNGFSGEHGCCTPLDIFHGIVSNPKCETLLKAKQWGLLGALTGDRSSSVCGHWNSIKICMRNRYVVEDAVTWLDYIELLTYFQKDLNNAKYICITDVKAEHDRLVARKQIIEAERRRLRTIEEARKKALKDKQLEAEFLKAKAVFFGLAFGNEKITIKVLESIAEFIEEGKILHHCVGSSNYWGNHDSLVMSARIDGKPVETIELSLKSMKIIQSRGLQNQATEHHGEVLKLVRKNMHIITEANKKAKNHSKEVAA